MTTVREIADRAAEALFGRPVDELTAAEREELLARAEAVARRESARQRQAAHRARRPPKPAKPVKGPPPHSLCQECREIDCPWVRDKQPVPGWTAEATVLPTNTAGGRESYRVTACPLYRPHA